MQRHLALSVVLLLSASLHAQTQMQDPRHLKLEYEDERLRVLKLTLAPGESTPDIQMGERIITYVNDGHIEVSPQPGAPSVIDVKAGATSHEFAGEVKYGNAGSSIWQCIITELKPPFAHATPPMQQPQAVAAVKTPSRPQETKPAEVVNAPPLQTPRPAASAPPAVQIEPPRQGEQPQPTFQQPTAIEPTALNVDGAKVAFLNGTELAYIERGSGNQVVVLVHDTLGDYRAWAPQLTALARNYRVIAYSRRYHYPNHSNGKEHDYTYDINAKDLADFIRGLNVGPVRLVGFGYGASIAAMVAADHPEIVKALALTEPGFEKLLDTTGAFRSSFAREEIYGIIRKPLTKDKPEKGIQTYVDWLGYQSWSSLSTEEQFRRKQNANALHAQTLDASPPNFTCTNAKKITAPTLILSGQKRSPNSAEIAGVLSGCIPNAERATVSNSGAAVYAENPSEANKLLMDFMAKH